ncbi:hypothetical protein CUMW_253420, partial [Citrus unshiu]
MNPHDIDVEDKVDWSSRTETVFIRIVYDHVKNVLLSSDEDREFEENFLGHGVHLDIEDNDSMESLSDTRTEKGLVGQLQLQLSGKTNKSEFDSYFKMASLVMNAKMEMVKCKSVESTSQCVEKWYIEECIEAVEKLGDIDGDTYNKLMDKLVPSNVMVENEQQQQSR